MSIASRITSIEEHIGNAYNKLDDLGIDLTGVDKNIDNIAEMLDTVYEDYPKVTGTGTEVTLDGTKVGKLGLDVKGNSTQDGTPAPDNEVPILSAGDNGSISEKIVNKNLIDVQNYSFTKNRAIDTTTGGIYQTSSGNYYATIGYIPFNNYSSKNIALSPSLVVAFYDKDKNYIGFIKAATENKIVPVGTSFIRIESHIDYIDVIQIEQGLTATNFVAHQEQTYTIPVQQPMRSIGTVRDEFIQDTNGNWFERHNVLRYIFTGTETFTNPSTNRFNALLDIDYPYRVNTIKYVCNSFVAVAQKFTDGDFNTANSDKDNVIGFGARWHGVRIKSTNFSTVSELTTWLAQQYANGTPVYVDYQLTTPQDLPCTEEQIAILEKLPETYSGQTNIYSLDETPAYIEAKALKGE